MGLLSGFGYGRSAGPNRLTGANGSSGSGTDGSTRSGPGDRSGRLSSRSEFANAVAGTSVPKAVSHLHRAISATKGHSSDGDGSSDDDLEGVWFQDSTVTMHPNPAFNPRSIANGTLSATPDPDMLHAQSMAASDDDEYADGVVLDFASAEDPDAFPDSTASAAYQYPPRRRGSSSTHRPHNRVSSSDYDSDAARTDAELSELTRNWKRQQQHSVAARASGSGGSRGSSNGGSVAAASPLVASSAAGTAFTIPPPPVVPFALADTAVSPSVAGNVSAPPPPPDQPPTVSAAAITTAANAAPPDVNQA